MPKIDAVAEAVSIITAAGFAEDGQTAAQAVRIPTVSNPVFGGVGGERRTFGGRMRFAKGDLRVTVGRITTCIYRVVPGQRDVAFIANIRTSDVASLKSILEAHYEVA